MPPSTPQRSAALIMPPLVTPDHKHHNTMIKTVTIVRICQDLLRIDTSNPGATEERGARYVVDSLARAGLPVDVIEPQPGRCSVVSRVSGRDPHLPPLLIHGHLDVVPAGDGWAYDPFGGVEADGCLWGRGAVDMKGAVAMMLALQLELVNAQAPRRDLVFAYFADEETGGTLGSRWIVEHQPELFRGVKEAIGEVGGFTVTLPTGQRLYMLQVAERGLLWVKVQVPGGGGHAAFSTRPNALLRAVQLVSRIAQLRTVGPPSDALMALREQLEKLSPVPGPSTLADLGTLGAMAAQAESTSFVPTVLHSGHKINMVPDMAELCVDCRVVPGGEAAALAALADLLDEDMVLEILTSSPGFEAPWSGELPQACAAAIATFDPEAILVPYAQPAGTDAQRLRELGIFGYGFLPLVLPEPFDYFGMFHATNERVPVQALLDGYRILRELALTY